MSHFPFKRVVVPVDLSDFSMSALDQAIALVESPAQIQVVHVLREMSSADPGVVWGDVDDKSRIAHAEEAVKAALVERNLGAASVYVAIGNPPKEITKLSSDIEADLIVIHSHGRTGPAHMLIGSVAERVVRMAHCPVLVIRD